MDIQTYTDKEQARSHAQSALMSMLEQHHDAPLLFLASGGSALSILPNELPAGLNITVTVLDDRFDVSPDEKNFSALSDTPFFESVVRSGGHAIPPAFDAKSAASAAYTLESSVRTWKRENPHGVILATLGIGADGHAAGIAPMPDSPVQFNELFDTPEHWFAGYDTEGRLTPPMRFTATLPFLRTAVDAAIAFATGKEKCNALVRAHAAEGTLCETPARILREMRSVQLFTNCIV